MKLFLYIFFKATETIVSFQLNQILSNVGRNGFEWCAVTLDKQCQLCSLVSVKFEVNNSVQDLNLAQSPDLQW